MRELWTNIAKTSGARIYSMALGVFTLFLTARLLGPEGRGTVAAITTWVTMFSTFSYLSLGQVALHRMSEDRERTQYGALLGSLLALAGAISVLGWLVAFAMTVFTDGGAFRGLPGAGLFVGFCGLPFAIWEQYGSSVLMALERLQIYNRFQIIGRTVGVVGVFLLVAWLQTGVFGVLVANLIAQVTISIGGIGFLLREAKRLDQRVVPTLGEITGLIAGGLKLHLNAVGTFLFTSAGILMLNHYLGATETGYYQLAFQLMSAMMIVPQAASMVVYGKVVSLGPNGAWPLNKRLLFQITALMILASLLIGGTAPWWLVLLAGESFRPAVRVFQWMLFGTVGMTFSALMAPQWIGRGYFAEAASLTFFVGVINLLANLRFIPRLGMLGAVYAFLGTYLFSVFGNGLMAWHCASQTNSNSSRPQVERKLF